MSLHFGCYYLFVFGGIFISPFVMLVRYLHHLWLAHWGRDFMRSWALTIFLFDRVVGFSASLRCIKLCHHVAFHFKKFWFLFCNFNKTCVTLFYFTDVPGAFKPSGTEVYYKIPPLLKKRKFLVCNSSQKMGFVIDPRVPSVCLRTFGYLFTQSEKEPMFWNSREMCCLPVRQLNDSEFKS